MTRDKMQYACRKTLTVSRPRVRGRFAKNEELCEATRSSSQNHDEYGQIVSLLVYYTVLSYQKHPSLLINMVMYSSSHILHCSIKVSNKKEYNRVIIF